MTFENVNKEIGVLESNLKELKEKLKELCPHEKVIGVNYVKDNYKKAVTGICLHCRKELTSDDVRNTKVSMEISC